MAEQKLLLGNIRGPQGAAGPNTVSSSTTTSGFENGQVLFNNNGKVGAKNLSASDVGAIPKGNTKALADELTWKTGAINTPAGWDDYALIQLSSNYGKGILKKLEKEESAIVLFVNNSDSYTNVTAATIQRNSTGGSIYLSNVLSLRLSTSGVTKNSTEFNIYRVEGIV
ncbi:hypothetical protein [Fournierella sp.]|uniref:hypothetical protein n=1 Tax=Allofournierella sp. TaxID=1940256 RepID=UPI0025C25EF5|nr:hypothetical protein [Fournierella sp.]